MGHFIISKLNSTVRGGSLSHRDMIDCASQRFKQKLFRNRFNSVILYFPRATRATVLYELITTVHIPNTILLKLSIEHFDIFMFIAKTVAAGSKGLISANLTGIRRFPCQSTASTFGMTRSNNS